MAATYRARGFEDAIRNGVSLGGDSDTITAITGSIAEALHGIPDKIADKAWAYLPKDMQAVISGLYKEADSLLHGGRLVSIRNLRPCEKYADQVRRLESTPDV